MDEFLAMMGWYNSGGCSCSPKKYTWRNKNLPEYKIKTIPSRMTWEMYENDIRIRVGQSLSLESQYNEQFES